MSPKVAEKSEHKSYIPALDGLRAIAVLMVLIHHANTQFHTNLFKSGIFGVDVFFVLSGFLITAGLLNEMSETKTINLKRFYIRRIRRLFPALICLLTAYSIFAVFIFPAISVKTHFASVLLAMTYLTDYSTALFNFPTPLLSHTWSLSVEEHYYILWPLVLLFLLKYAPLKRWLVIVGFLYVLSVVWRGISFSIWDNIWITYYRFDTRLSGLLLGSFLALRLQNLKPSQKNAGTESVYLSIFLFIFFVCFSAVCFESKYTPLTLMTGFFLAEITSFFIIEGAVKGQLGLINRVLSNKILVYIGSISYGIYLYHVPVALIVNHNVNLGSFLGTTLIAAISIFFAALSYHLIELPVRYPKNRVKK